MFAIDSGETDPQSNLVRYWSEVHKDAPVDLVAFSERVHAWKSANEIELGEGTIEIEPAPVGSDYQIIKLTAPALGGIKQGTYFAGIVKENNEVFFDSLDII